MTIVLAGYQFYKDVLPVFTSEDTFMKADYIMVTKRIGAGNTMSGRTSTFSSKDTQELKAQPFVKKIGEFTSTNYKTDARMGINGQQILNTEMFFESVPDEFVDIDLSAWKYEEGSDNVPVILPRTYINMYNFGIARNRSLPQISEGLMGMIDFDIHVRGNGKERNFKGNVVAFSNSLSAILVPQSFMDWSNKEFAPDDDCPPTRLLIEVDNPADEGIGNYFDQNGLEMESDKLNAEKTTYFLRLMVSLVMIVGIIISILSFYILMLSIYLLVQKNTEKLQNLLLIGYPSYKVAMPYQALTLTLNAIVLLVALITVVLLRNYYMGIIHALFPNIESGTILHAVLLGLALFITVSLLNIFVIRNKINKI